MKRTQIRWTSLTIVITMLLSLLIPFTALAAGPRIDITSPFAATNVATGLPQDTNAVPRFTTSRISITANIQNITDSQTSSIYYEITNIKSDSTKNITTVVKSNPAIHVPGAFTITFNNVDLTEGLNKITIMMGDTNVTSSAPSWVYFTPTTNITNLTANGVPFLDTQSYPTNPTSTSTVTIAGLAANATSVEVTVGSSTPKTVFLNNGTFFFTVDNKVNSTATFRVNSGDNPMTIVAKNSTKTYQIKKNLIYDDGNPYAFNANITTTYIANEPIAVAVSPATVTLLQSDIAKASIEIWTDINKTGTKLTESDFTAINDVAAVGKTKIVFSATVAPDATAYAFYSYGKSALLTTPTTTTTTVGVSANLKNDLDAIGNLKYRFVNIIAGGVSFGPYDLTGAVAATTALNNGLFPNSVNQGYSNDTLIGIQGTGFKNPGVALVASLADNAGANAIPLLGSAGLTSATAPSINATGTMVFFKLPVGAEAMTNAKSPYKLTLTNGTTILNTYTLTVNNAGPIAAVTSAAIPGLLAGYAATPSTITLTGVTAPSGGAFAPGSLRVDAADITGQNILLTANATSTAAVGGNTEFTYTLPTGLLAGDYKLKVSYAGNELTQRNFTVAPANPTLPTVSQPLTPVTLPRLTAPTYIVVTGANLGINVADITSAGLYNGAVEVASLTPYFLNGTTAFFKLGNQAASLLVSGTTYDLKFSVNVRTSSGALFSNTALTVIGAVKSLTPSGATYANEVITDVSPLQISQASLGTTNLTITGLKLLDKSKMLVEVLNQDGTSTAGAGLVTTNDTVTGLQATASLPVLSAGTYIIRISYNGNVLAQSMLSLTSPTMSSINPTLLSLNQWLPTSQITVTGTGFGLDASKLSLNFVSDASGQISTQNVVNYPTGLTSSIIRNTSGITEVAPIWNTGTITAVPNNVSQTFVFAGVTITVTSGPVGVAATAANATTGSVTVVNGSTSAVYAAALLSALNAVKAFGAGAFSSYTFALNALLDGVAITGIAGMGDNNNATINTATSTLVFANSATTATAPTTLGVDAVREVDTATIVGPATTTGQITVTVNGNGLPAAGVTTGVIPVANASTAATNTTNITTALASALGGYYTLTNPTATTILFTQVNGGGGAALTFTINAPSSLQGGSQAIFTLPNLSQGMYSVSLLNNGQPVGTSLKYTVAPPQPSLQENVAMSVPGRYKVFDFSAVITIPTERDQVAQFKFYNFITDTVAPTIFSYHYIDANLPYINHAVLGQTQRLDELNTNTIGEMPNSLYVYASPNTMKVNIYVGDYTSASTAYTSITTSVPDVTLAYKIFTIPLTGIANGSTKFTIVPSNLVGTSTQQGENLTGRKIYDVNVASTPYILINNVFTGMVVKDPLSEITCITSAGTLVAGCISGRVVNVPLTGWPTSANVEMYVNGNKSNLNSPTSNPSDFDPLTSTFHVQFDATHGGPLKEGKNTISFYIYISGVLATQSSFEIFVFSTSSPEFQLIKPVETTDIPKYIVGKSEGAYATSETAVSFKGQFINATDLKLTVKQKDANGVQITKYDRRVSTSTLPDPLNGNPGYLNTVNFLLAPLTFTTNSINLAIKGDTIFEFTITNSSNVTITKTITITREPLPYVVVYPKLAKNANGLDQANINSNYIEIEMEAENADSVNLGGKTDAVKRQITDQYGNLKTHFFYEINDLKTGMNTVKFTVVRGKEKKTGSFLLFNANTTVEGAQFKTLLKNTMKVYNGDVELKFPANTNLMRNDTAALNQYLTSDRKILFGIASNVDGRVDKYLNPSATDGQSNNPNPLIPPSGKLLLTEPTGRFRPASSLYWIDAGTIPSNETDQTKALTGGGRLPYDADNFFSRNIKDLVVPTKRGTLSLKYDPNIRDEAWKYITVYHYDLYEDYSGSLQYRWRNLGGVVDLTKNTITVPFETFGYYQVMYMNQSFDDVTTHPWARNQLDTLYSRGIMLNKSNTAFTPNDNISRGEFATLLVKLFDIPLQYTETSTFTDVLRVNPLTNGLYDYRYIETAAKAGIVRGGGGGRFSPDESVTRQDAAVMISRAADLKMGVDADKALLNLQKLFTDAAVIDSYARTAVEAVSKAALVQGKENVLLQGQAKATFRFDPAQTFTRAEAAEVAIRVLKQQKKIPK